MNTGKAWIYLSGLLLVMLAGLIYGLTWGEFWLDGSALLDNPWGVVSLVDVYVGFLLFLGWVWIREELLLTKLLWSVAILAGGNLFACGYALLALRQSGGKLDLFFLGTNKR